MVFQLRSFTETCDFFQAYWLRKFMSTDTIKRQWQMTGEILTEKLNCTSMTKLPWQLMFWLPRGMPNGALGHIFMFTDSLCVICSTNEKANFRFQLLKFLHNYVRCCSGSQSGEGCSGLWEGKARGNGPCWLRGGWSNGGGCEETRMSSCYCTIFLDLQRQVQGVEGKTG